MFLKQSTSVTVRFGQFVDSTDGITAETALTITQALMKLSKSGGAFAQKSAAGNATHDADGWYSTTLSTADTNTVGSLILQVNVSGAAPVFWRWQVLHASTFDAQFASSPTGFNSVGAVTLASATHTGAVIPTVSSVTAIAANGISATSIASNAITAAKIATDAITSAKIADGALTAAKFAAGAFDAVWTVTVRALTAGVTVTTNSDKTGYALSAAGVQAVWDALTSALTTASSIGKLLVDNINATISSRSSHSAADARTEMDSNSTQLAKLGSPAADISADIADIKVQTAEIETDTQDIQTRIPAALVSGRIDANAAAINDSAVAAVRLALSAGQIIPGTVDTVTNGHTPTATEFQADDITEATADHYNATVVIWTSGALVGQRTSVTDYANVGGIGQFTVVEMTEAPANNDTFILL